MRQARTHRSRICSKSCRSAARRATWYPCNQPHFPDVALLQVQGQAAATSRRLRERTHSGRPLLPVRESCCVQAADSNIGLSFQPGLLHWPSVKVS